MDFQKIEKKWQKAWEKKKVFEVSEKSKKPKYYVLEMFPYPSGAGLHMGHALNYTLGDVYARFKRMQGFNVLYPMGFDSLGLPAENAAIKAKQHPKAFTEKAIKNYIRQMKELGLSYDWSKTLNTHDSEYYKWDQWIFLQMLEKGVAYRKKAPVNWCPKCSTVLANEQVHNGKCWRHSDVDVELKQLEQWFLKTTKYADELLREVEKLKWPERIKVMQKNWIGKSYGTEINFEKWPIFTTRPDTIFGVTFMVISAQHPDLMDLVIDKQKKEVEKFLKKIKSTSAKDLDLLEKEGAFTGSYVINPINNEKVPVYVGNFVVADYGSGMVMAVPAHDQRDFEFAKKYGIKIKEVIVLEGMTSKGARENIKERAYIDKGILINSGKFNGIDSEKAKEKITEYLQKNKLGKKKIQFKLKDWLVSRQRYWGTPIPIVYCDECGIVPIPEKDLPVRLPEKVKFGKGNPLEMAKAWVNIKCPKCKGKARRETDTMDTFANSSWYFLRYCDNKNKKNIFDKRKVGYWMPVDQYIGGAEHACMHLIYARFYTKFLKDIGLIKFGEPFLKLFNQGMLHGEDGNKMSKSLGNVINPDMVSKKYGMDTARFFLLSLATPEKSRDWSDKGIQGSLKFIKKVIDFNNFGKTNKFIESKLNKTIKEVTTDIEDFKYNFAIIKIREFFESIDEISKKDFGEFLKLLSVFCPHIAEELWKKINGKGFISLAVWPKPGKINEKLLQQEKLIEKVINDINNILRILENKKEKRKKTIIFAIPSEIEIYKKSIDKINKRINMPVEVLSISEAKKTGKKIKAKPGKPGILIE
jgi:leucyl-tRNA synthetase